MDRFANQAIGLQQVARSPTPFDMTESALASARTLATRVEGLVDRLLGETPEPGQGSSAENRRSGCLHQLTDEAIRTEKRLAEASAALDRLDMVLP